MPRRPEKVSKRDGVVIEAASVDDLRLPLVVYRGALDATDGRVSRDAAAAAARDSGWELQWVLAQGAAGEPHYHSTTHEAVFVLEGRTRVRYGVEGDVEAELEAGDVVFHPAGCFHEGAGDTGRVRTGGAYPVGGVPWDWRGDPPDDELLARMNELPAPPHPVLGGSIEELLDRL